MLEAKEIRRIYRICVFEYLAPSCLVKWKSAILAGSLQEQLCVRVRLSTEERNLRVCFSPWKGTILLNMKLTAARILPLSVPCSTGKNYRQPLLACLLVAFAVVEETRTLAQLLLHLCKTVVAGRGKESPL